MNEHDPTKSAGEFAVSEPDDAVSVAAAAEPAVEKLRQELSAANDRALRAQADLENYRKRVRREMDEERQYAQLPLLTDLLPVIDNIGRAVAAADTSADVSGLLAGVKLVAQQLEGVLARHQCQRIEALHQTFDPHLHAAIMQQPTNEFPPNTVVTVAQEGYQLRDRVLRPAQVIVSSAPAN